MAGTGKHDQLFASGRIGPMRLLNRIVLPAMDQNMCTDQGLLTEANIGHYEERAAGGAGLLILETSAVSYPVGATSRHQPSLADDTCIPGLSELARRAHHHGAAVIVQACHHGKTAGVDTVEGRPLLVPSLPLPAMNPAGMAEGLTAAELMKMGRRMQGKRASHTEATADELAEVVDAFGAAARRVAAAGCDGMEVHAAHGYLLSTFLSPHWNQRTDSYGGSVENRCRLLTEVVAAIEASTPHTFAIVVRIDGQEFGIDDGITPALAAQHAAAAERAGAHAVHVSAIGAPDSGVSFTEGPLPWRPTQYRELARTVREAVNIPVIAVGRISPDDAVTMIRDGETDFVAMGRQLLADPELPRRLRENRPDLVRPCINCFVCVAENFWDATPVCAVNARLGHPESRVSVPAATPRSIMIIGGGPAGLECARVAAQRGHRVALYEAARTLGGTARFSALTTPLNGELVAYLEAAAIEAGVEIHLDSRLTASEVTDLAPDVVVVATGARRERPLVAGANLPHVLTGDDLRDLLTGETSDAADKLGPIGRTALRLGHASRLTRNLDLVRTLSATWMPINRSVVVLGAGLVGTELAEFLAERGRHVTVLESGLDLAPEMAHPRRWRALHEARRHGVTFVTNAQVEEIEEKLVRYRIDGVSHDVAAGTVIIAGGIQPDPTLATELAHTGLTVHTIGDAAEVGYIQGAIRTAHDLATSL